MVVECHNCEVNIEAIEIANHRVCKGEDPHDEFKYTLLKCPKCNLPILMEQNLEFDDFNYNRLSFNIPRQVYPLLNFHLNPEIPTELQEALLESIKCFRTNAYTATVIMCRRAIEGFCQLQGITENNLQKAIHKLKENNIINDQIFEWANELRISGNEAAHKISSTFSNADAKDILDFTIAILDYSYSFQEKFKKFKQRRNAVTNNALDIQTT